MDFFRVSHRRVNPAVYFRKWGLLGFLFAASLLCSCVSLYIPQFAIKLSLRSLPMLLVGFWFGIPAGLVNGAAVDLITFSWGSGLDYSPWFLIQSMSIGVIGGLGRHLMGMDVRRLSRGLVGIVGFFSLLYSLMFPSEIPHLLLYALCFCVLGAAFGKEPLGLVLLIMLALVIYLSSLGLGTLGATSIRGMHSPLLFFRARLWKELVRLFIFFLLCRFFLRGGYGSAR